MGPYTLQIWILSIGIMFDFGLFFILLFFCTGVCLWVNATNHQLSYRHLNQIQYKHKIRRKNLEFVGTQIRLCSGCVVGSWCFPRNWGTGTNSTPKQTHTDDAVWAGRLTWWPWCTDKHRPAVRKNNNKSGAKRKTKKQTDQLWPWHLHHTMTEQSGEDRKDEVGVKYCTDSRSSLPGIWGCSTNTTCVTALTTRKGNKYWHPGLKARVAVKRKNAFARLFFNCCVSVVSPRIHSLNPHRCFVAFEKKKISGFCAQMRCTRPLMSLKLHPDWCSHDFFLSPHCLKSVAITEKQAVAEWLVSAFQQNDRSDAEQGVIMW